MFGLPPNRSTVPVRYSSPPSASQPPLRYSPTVPAFVPRSAPARAAPSSSASSCPKPPLPPPIAKTTSSATFDIRKLYNREKNRDDHRQELYDSVVRKIHHRVETVAQRKETQCLFQVPQFILGMPLYDPFQCTGYVIQTLKAQGFHVKYFHPNTLLIDWSRHLIEPYVNAMDRREASREAVVGAPAGGHHAAHADHSGRTAEVGPLDLNYVPSGKLFGS